MPSESRRFHVGAFALGVEVTGGVGEHDPETRRRLAADLAYLGVRIDPELNATIRGDAVISPPDATVATIVVTAREDLKIAAGARSVLYEDGRL